MLDKNSCVYKILHWINVKRLNVMNKIQNIELTDWYKKSSYPNKIQRFRNIHAGERCFIIGNGPSLTPSDLDIIKDEISFSCNKIYKIFDKTKWRPFYYVVDHRDFVKDDSYNIINTAVAKAKFVAIEFEKKLAKPYLNTDVILMKEKTTLHDLRPEWNLKVDEYIGAGHTVTFLMVQLAIYMGFKKIYLIGNDCSYLSTIENANAGNNHFYESDNEKISSKDAYNLFYAFESIRKCAQDNGVEIYNATRGGALEIFERVNLEEVVEYGD